MPMKLRLAEEIEGDGNGTVLSEVINIGTDAENSREPQLAVTRYI